MRSSGFVALLLPLLGAEAQRPPNNAPSALCFNRDSGAPPVSPLLVGQRCSSIWIDSLRSANTATKQFAIQSLAIVGGREAADALRAHYEQTRDPRNVAVISAMATTGSPEDVKFLIAQLGRRDSTDSWPSIQAAAMTLGLLHATEARDSLIAVAQRSSGRYTDRMARWALARLSRPPCEDSVTLGRTEGLLDIVMRCEPDFLGTKSSYRDKNTGKIWFFPDSAWKLRAPAPADTAIHATLTTTIQTAGDRDAFVNLDMWCGMLCGEGWTYRLRRTGRVWRVIWAQFNWVS